MPSGKEVDLGANQDQSGVLSGNEVVLGANGCKKASPFWNRTPNFTQFEIEMSEADNKKIDT